MENSKGIAYLFGLEDCHLCDRKVDELHAAGYTVFKMDAKILNTGTDSILSSAVMAGAKALLELQDDAVPVSVDIYGEPV